MLLLYVKDGDLFLISLHLLIDFYPFPYNPGFTLKEKGTWWFNSSSLNVGIHNPCTNADTFSTEVIDPSDPSMWVFMA